MRWSVIWIWALLLLPSIAVEAQNNPVNLIITNVHYAGYQITEIEGGGFAEFAVIAQSPADVQCLTCSQAYVNPSIQPLESSVTFFYVQVRPELPAAMRHLELCQADAVVAMSRPDKYDFFIRLTPSQNDTGVHLRNATGTAWGYRVTFGSPGATIACALRRK